MRTKTKVSDLRVGMIAYLPYFGKLLKSKITHVSPPIQTKVDVCVVVRYEVLSEPLPRHGNQCAMRVESQYEVYTRKASRHV